MAAIEPVQTEIIRKRPSSESVRSAVIRYLLETKDGFGQYFEPLMGAIGKCIMPRPGPPMRMRIMIGDLRPDVVAFLTFRSLVGLIMGANDEEWDATVPTAAEPIGRALEAEAAAVAKSEKAREAKKAKKGKSADAAKDWSDDERLQLGLDLLFLVSKQTDLIKLTMRERDASAADADENGAAASDPELQLADEEPGEDISDEDVSRAADPADNDETALAIERRPSLKSYKMVVPTKVFWGCVRRQKQYLSELSVPAHPPLHEPPKPWVAIRGGGYERKPALKLLKRKENNSFTQSFDDVLSKMDLSRVFEGVNALQGTAWRIDARVLKFITEALAKQSAREPWYGDRLDAKLPTRRDWQWVQKLSEGKPFYFAHQLDYRGRAYPLGNWLQPQGDDVARALLQFATAKPIGTPEAKRWLAIHGANMMKRPQAKSPTIKQRVAFVMKHSDAICASARDPWKTRDWLDLAQRKHVYRFLTFCYEWKELMECEKEGRIFESHLPVGMDGTCNGFQHFAAMLRDGELAKWTNVAPSGKRPRDLYAAVADSVKKAVDNDHRKSIATIKDDLRNMTERKLAKKVVMILPYGSTRSGIKSNIRQYILEEGKKNAWDGRFNRKSPKALRQLNKASEYLTRQFIWTIRTQFSSAWEIREWLRQCATIVVSRGIPMVWISPIGLPVMQSAFHMRSKEIQSLTVGKARVKCHLSETTDYVRVTKQISGASPNFVHALDASHMLMTAIAAQKQGITSLRMVHDCYATHAADAPRLAAILREEFVRLYCKGDILDAHHQWVTSIVRGDIAQQNSHPIAQLVEKWLEAASAPPPPTRGRFSVARVAKSEYFFC